jgi:hypothetical protein
VWGGIKRISLFMGMGGSEMGEGGGANLRIQ